MGIMNTLSYVKLLNMKQTFSIFFWVAYHSSKRVKISTCFLVFVMQPHARELGFAKESRLGT